MKEVLNTVAELTEELAGYYAQFLEQMQVDTIDEFAGEYYDAITKNSGQLSNENIRYFSSMFAFHSYRLNAMLSKASLRSDIAKLYYEKNEAEYVQTAMTNAQEGGHKMTREDKLSGAKVGTIDEAKVALVFERVTQAIETRIKGLDRLIRTLDNLGAMNMSEAKLGGNR